jgi:hypothetical protein
MKEKEKEVNIVSKFWSEWESAIDKAEKIQKLPFFDRPKIILDSEIMQRAAATMVNSYLEDLYEYMITKYNIEVKDDQDS